MGHEPPGPIPPKCHRYAEGRSREPQRQALVRLRKGECPDEVIQWKRNNSDQSHGWQLECRDGVVLNIRTAALAHEMPQPDKEVSLHRARGAVHIALWHNY